MDSIKQVIAGMGLFGFFWLMAGCAEVVVPGAFTGAGEIYRYNTSKYNSKTNVTNLSIGSTCFPHLISALQFVTYFYITEKHWS
jgi:hypothetical protein